MCAFFADLFNDLIAQVPATSLYKQLGSNFTFTAKFLPLCRASRARPIRLNAMAAFHGSKCVHALRVGVRGVHGHDLAAIPAINRL